MTRAATFGLLLLLSTNLAAQTPPSGSIFGALYSSPGPHGSLVRLEQVQGVYGLPFVIAQVSDSDGLEGIAGQVARGGLNIGFANIYQARDGNRMLRAPRTLLSVPDWMKYVTPSQACQIVLLEDPPGKLRYICGVSEKELTRIR